jgi:hypothetical protein
MTPDLVDRFKSMKPSVVERPLDESRVDYLGLRVAEGNAIPFNWSYVTFKGEDYRMNGQHSSIMLSRLNGSSSLKGLSVHVDQFGADTEADMVNIFRQIDVRKSGRSTLDVTNAYASVVPELNDIDRGLLKKAAEAIAWVSTQVDKLTSVQGDDRYGTLMEPQNLPYLQWLGGVLHQDAKVPEMKNSGVLGAMYKTHGIDADVARVFWTDVARGGDEDDDTSPPAALDNWLYGVWGGKIRQADSDKPISVAHIYQACAYAWNAHVDGKAAVIDKRRYAPQRPHELKHPG